MQRGISLMLKREGYKVLEAREMFKENYLDKTELEKVLINKVRDMLKART